MSENSATADVAVPDSAVSNAFRLNNGDRFPDLTARLVGGGTLPLPGDLAGSWGVVLFNRGHWCPFCRTQLRDFERQLDQLGKVGGRVVSLSVDNETDATAEVAEDSLTFPVAYGIDPAHMAATVGSYLSDGSDGHPVYTQATGFILAPDGTVAVAVYSSSAIGRLTAPDAVGLIKYATSHS